MVNRNWYQWQYDVYKQSLSLTGVVLVSSESTTAPSDGSTGCDESAGAYMEKGVPQNSSNRMFLLRIDVLFYNYIALY